eukprot:1603489-Rhodomonas_salina.3
MGWRHSLHANELAWHTEHSGPRSASKHSEKLCTRQPTQPKSLAFGAEIASSSSCSQHMADISLSVVDISLSVVKALHLRLRFRIDRVGGRPAMARAGASPPW